MAGETHPLRAARRRPPSSGSRASRALDPLVPRQETGLVEWLEPGRKPTCYRTLFIGRGGEVLKTDHSLSPGYTFRGDELYVRARIEASTGAVAWTQPVFEPSLSAGDTFGTD